MAISAEAFFLAYAEWQIKVYVNPENIYGEWGVFSELIKTHEEEIINADFFDSISGNSNPNVLQFSCLILKKISLCCTSFEEVAMDFAVISSYSERYFIRALEFLNFFHGY